MKYLVLLIIFTIYFHKGYCYKIDSIHNQHHKEVRNVLWFTPSQTGKINGLALGFQANPRKGNQTINGANVELYFIPLILIVPVFVNTIDLPVWKFYNHKEQWDFYNVFFSQTDTVRECINGVNISLGTYLRTKRQVNGVTICASVNTCVVHKGFAFSLYTNWIRKFKGVCIAPFGNMAIEGHGVQVGLVNSCFNCSGLQVGLINQNGHRITPFFNFRSRKKAARLAATALKSNNERRK